MEVTLVGSGHVTCPAVRETESEPVFGVMRNLGTVFCSRRNRVSGVTRNLS